ncbi:hypothetical protein C0Q70_18100 [Pomacea canaliculata]|uniref:AIG1-type G domain-containing protein n=1 Tax=Pomacea canaliculata TaxID=400727 RepID=A0A2T7NMA4_POMCA|nr:hypothetical protein C0Q70_18100 [Pomacea canaliculata]
MSFAVMEVLKDFPDQECRIILLGKSGAGKSKSANSILSTDLFDVSSEHDSRPRIKCARSSLSVYEKSLLVVDTPGFAESQDGRQSVVQVIKDAIVATCPGPHAVVLVTRCDVTITSAETDIVSQLRSVLGEELRRHLDINERYVVFNNEGSREEQERQVQQLLRLVHQMVLESPRQVFSCPLLRECEKDITYMRNRLRMLEPRIETCRDDVRRLSQDEGVAPEKLGHVLALTAQAIEDLKELAAVDEKLTARVGRENLTSCSVS